MFYIYIFFNNKEILYIGKTINIYSRFNDHKSSKNWFKQVTHIALANCNTKLDMDIYEIYYINKLKPKYNINSVYNETPTFHIEDLTFITLSITEFYKKFSSSYNKKNKPKNYKLLFEETLKDSIDITASNLSLLDIKSNKFHWYINEDTIRSINITNYSFLKTVLVYILNNDIDLNKEFIFKFKKENTLNKNDIYLDVSFTHFNTNTYKEVISCGSYSFISCVYYNKNRTPIWCNFINSRLIYIIQNDFSIKNILKWR